jgi:kumamolisin
VAILAVEANFRETFVQQRFNVGAYAGRKLFVYFGVHGDGGKHQFTHQYVDDVSLTGAGPKPTPTPTVKPTTAPTASPTSSPTTSPTATPTAAPTTSPVACTGTKESGPLRNANGHLATSVADAFDFPVQHGCNGATQTAAIVINSPVHQSDINAYMTASGVKELGTVTNVPVDGGGTYGDSNSIEATLDAETIIGLAPAATVLVYNVPTLTDQSILDAYNKTVSDNLADVVNSSFGGCESADPTGDMAEDAVAVQGAAKGITFVGTTGDTGSDECDTGNNPPGVSGTNGPHFLSVGSMDFTQNATTGVLETVKYASNPSNGFLSGGGVSTVYPLPSYQEGIKNVITSGRNQPDISLPGVDVAVYLDGSAFGTDGTSWSGPEVTALLTETAQLHNGTRVGFVNPAIYALFTSTNYADFYDITSGTNGAYKAVPGYDQVTGIGAPKGYAFAQAL